MKKLNIDPTFLIIIVLLAGSSLMRGGFSNPMEWVMEKVLIIPGVFIGLTFHEFAHAFTAYKLGDQTPRLQGRVTLNPMAHLDIAGLLCLFFIGFGWGQPVQINPYAFKNRRRDEFLVSIAGVAMNFLLAFAFAFIIKIIMMVTGGQWVYSGFGESIWNMLYMIVYINLVLMFFNLIPVPPLDGFNILAQIFNFGQKEIYWKLYQYGSWLLIAIVVFGIAGMIISPCVRIVFNFIASVTGLPTMY